MDNNLPNNQNQPPVGAAPEKDQPANAYYQSIPGDAAALTPTPVPESLPTKAAPPVQGTKPSDNPVVNSLLGQPEVTAKEQPVVSNKVSPPAGAKPNDRRQLIILGLIGVLVIVGGLAWLWWPSPAPQSSSIIARAPANAAENRTIGVGTDNVTPEIEESTKASLFNQLTLLYPDAKVINLGSDKTRLNHQESLGVSGVVFQAYDASNDATYVYASLNDFPLVPDHAPAVWLEGASQPVKRGGVGERVDRGLEASVVYFVTRLDGDMRVQYNKVSFSADSPNEPDKQGIRFAVVDFSKAK